MNVIDLGKAAVDAGIRVPVFMTQAAFDKVVAWTEADTKHTGVEQSQAERLEEVLFVLKNEAKKGRHANLESLPFQVRAVQRDRRNARGGEFVPLIAKAKRDGSKKLTEITIMLSGET